MKNVRVNVTFAVRPRISWFEIHKSLSVTYPLGEFTYKVQPVDFHKLSSALYQRTFLARLQFDSIISGYRLPSYPVFKRLPTRQAHEGLLTSAFGEQVKQRYLVFARSVDAYSTRLYVEWEQRVGVVATEKLKQPILCSLATSRTQLSFENTVDGAAMKDYLGHSPISPVKHNKVSIHQQAVAPTNGKGALMPPPPYGVNFATELHMIIRESKYLDRMGFQVSMLMLRVLGVGGLLLGPFPWPGSP